jgi:transcriptional regulator with XRE-family HTH domain
MHRSVSAHLTGPSLRKLRERAHLSQIEAAKRLKVSRRVYQSWESDDPPVPWPRHRLALAEFRAELEGAEVAA